MSTSSTSSQRAGELLRDLEDKLTAQAISALGVTAAKARCFAESAVSAIARDWGGQYIYIPMDILNIKAARNAEIYAKFKGDNQVELAVEYGISHQHLYRIIAAERERRQPKQYNLLGDD